ncbi:hypothetical protein TELCIR_17492 [Teladorsagia circumcincta]|uniref:Ground-like domain protein n=1 Tax=Teladorsagia circumcincta TaxID=45464 RepID=A0A2G9TSM5_TELCI|nr:hypothetical protein TELCIR_17492 [Teladorsagia circumcincta]
MRGRSPAVDLVWPASRSYKSHFQLVSHGHPSLTVSLCPDKMLLQLISLVLLPFAVNGIGFGGCGCGMQIPPICLPSLPRIQLPSLCPPPACGCGRKKRQVIRSPEVVASDDRKCSSDQLKEIILNGIKKNQSQAMSVIHSEVCYLAETFQLEIAPKKPLSYKSFIHIRSS